MKRLSNLLSLLVITSVILTSCDSFVQLKTSNTVGDWYHDISKIMGGYQISKNTKLTIIRNDRADYSYFLEETVIDEMYGGKPKTTYSSGRMEESMSSNNEWFFIGGSYGERGGYIEVPNDRWNDYKPSELKIYFAPRRGDMMTFFKY